MAPAKKASGKKASAKKPKGEKPAEERRKSGPQGNTTEQARRNDEIVAGKARGLSYGQLSATYDLSKTRVKAIVREWRESNPSLRRQDPIQIADDLLEGYQADIEELVILAATTTSDAAHVGAINARVQVRARITELLQALGVLPHDLGKLRVEIDARFTATTIVSILNEFDVPEEVRDALLEALEAGPEAALAHAIEGTATEVAA